MERESNQMQTLCRSGCGFYGSPATDGLCSLCYKEALKKKQQLPNATPSGHCAALTTASTTTHISPLSEYDVTDTGEQQQQANAAVPSDAIESPGPSAESDNGGEDKDDKDKGKKKNRCGICKKKVGLTGFQCRCGGLFCAVHRYSDKHQCNFDYREMGAAEIRRNNPVVVGEKIQKI